MVDENGNVDYKNLIYFLQLLYTNGRVIRENDSYRAWQSPTKDALEDIVDMINNNDTHQYIELKRIINCIYSLNLELKENKNYTIDDEVKYGTGFIEWFGEFLFGSKTADSTLFKLLDVSYQKYANSSGSGYQENLYITDKNGTNQIMVYDISNTPGDSIDDAIKTASDVARKTNAYNVNLHERAEKIKEKYDLSEEVWGDIEKEVINCLNIGLKSIPGVSYAEQIYKYINEWLSKGEKTKKLLEKNEDADSMVKYIINHQLGLLHLINIRNRLNVFCIKCSVVVTDKSDGTINVSCSNISFGDNLSELISQYNSNHPNNCVCEKDIEDAVEDGSMFENAQLSENLEKFIEWAEDYNNINI